MREVFSQLEVDAALRRVVSVLSDANERIKLSALARSAGSVVLHTPMQVLFNFKFSSPVDRAVYEIIVNHAISAEQLGPGGFDRCIGLLVGKLCGPTIISDERKTKGGRCVVPMAATAIDVNRIVSVYASRASVMTSAMLTRAIELAGFAGRIIVEKTKSNVPSVELVRGYTFDLLQMLPLDVAFIHPRTFCIDGYIESVSEIHHLLEAAAEAREPCVVFMRGASDDVKHTLKVNYDRGSLRVLPIGVRFDLEGMNTLVDLSVVSGSDLVTSLKGDLISSIKFHEAPVVDQVTVYKGRVVVSNAVTHERVHTHITDVRKRRVDEKDEYKGMLLDKRIRSLSPNHVVIRLPDDKDFVANSQAIDYALRAVKAAVDHGVFGDERRMVSTELASEVHADRCIKTLLQLGSLIAA